MLWAAKAITKSVARLLESSRWAMWWKSLLMWNTGTERLLRVWFAHIAVMPSPDSNKTTWLEPVTDEAYKEATSEK